MGWLGAAAVAGYGDYEPDYLIISETTTYAAAVGGQTSALSSTESR
jgi:hypothetical protein